MGSAAPTPTEPKQTTGEKKKRKVEENGVCSISKAVTRWYTTHRDPFPILATISLVYNNCKNQQV